MPAVGGKRFSPPCGSYRKESSVSLFEDSSYNYSDTFFVHFQIENRPSADDVRTTIESLGNKYELSGVVEDEGNFVSATIKSPQDNSAMDISFVQGEEVLEQVQNLMVEFKTITLMGDDQAKLSILSQCNARLDIYHFEKITGGEEQMLDPGGLLLVLEKLAKLAKGVGLDPQSNSLL